MTKFYRALLTAALLGGMALPAMAQTAAPAAPDTTAPAAQTASPATPDADMGKTPATTKKTRVHHRKHVHHVAAKKAAATQTGATPAGDSAATPGQ